MKRLTKIIATIGPTCDSAEMIEKMLLAGVNVFRFNFKHNTVEWHHELIERVRGVAKKLNLVVGALLDLQGPEIRIDLGVEEIALKIGDKIQVVEKLSNSGKNELTITHTDIIPHIDHGQRVVINDGQFEFTAEKKAGKTFLVSHSEGILKPRKTMNIPGADFPFPVLTERDYQGLELAKKAGVDYVALSFVRSASDVEFLQKQLNKHNIDSLIISKIETQQSINDLTNIISASDGLMVARGDLGVELPLEQVPYYQKLIIKNCIQQGKFAITATQMLETMIKSPMPTRAEVSDIANATYDLSDATMLSQESAFGEYPVKSVEIMRRTIEFNETKFADDSRKRFNYQLNGSPAMIAEAAYDLYIESQNKSEADQVQAFVIYTHYGATAKLISAFRPDVPIYAICPNLATATRLSLNYGVHSIVYEKNFKKQDAVTQKDILAGIDLLVKEKFIQKNKHVIVTHGDFWTVGGGSSTIKLITP